MGSLSSRVKAFLAAGTDQVDVAVDLAGPLTIFDAETGIPNVPNSSPLPSTPYSGQIRCDRNDGYVKQWNATTSIWEPLFPIPGALLQGSGGGWKQLTPPTASGITLGTGTTKHILDYIRLPGNMVYWRYYLLLGTSGALSGVVGLTLPVEFPYDISAGVNAGVNGDTVGFGTANCSVKRPVVAALNGLGPPGNLSFAITDTAAFVQPASPGTWGAASWLTASGLYRTSAV